MSETEIIEALAALLVPKLTGAEAHLATELCSGLPMDHPLALLDLAMHKVSTRLYPSYAALCRRVDDGGGPAPEEWIAAVDADRAQSEPTWAVFRALLAERFAEAERTVALHLERGIYEPRTAEAVLHDVASALANQSAGLLAELFPAVAARSEAKGGA